MEWAGELTHASLNFYPCVRVKGCGHLYRSQVTCIDREDSALKHPEGSTAGPVWTRGWERSPHRARHSTTGHGWHCSVLGHSSLPETAALWLAQTCYCRVQASESTSQPEGPPRWRRWRRPPSRVGRGGCPTQERQASGQEEETAALLGGGAHPVRRRRLSGAATEEGEDWRAATPEVPERAHRPEASVLQEAPDPKERLRLEEAAEDPVWGSGPVPRTCPRPPGGGQEVLPY